MRPLVLDASVALSWAFEDEWDPVSERALGAVAEGGAAVPAVWPFEIANALAVAERRGRITTADSVRFLALLSQLPLEVEAVGSEAAFELLELARAYSLSAYDAGYLRLALASGAPLATRDEGLREAAGKAGVRLL
ncbi:MAG: type II toxin-antitoxin system VapC family toxin [Clostridia bacterium]|nr:type II toxin-antitoxin system VapC family toxin [Clostridia bacterium]